jgi:hypothetical protein
MRCDSSLRLVRGAAETVRLWTNVGRLEFWPKKGSVRSNVQFLPRYAYSKRIGKRYYGNGRAIAAVSTLHSTLGSHSSNFESEQFLTVQKQTR